MCDIHSLVMVSWNFFLFFFLIQPPLPKKKKRKPSSNSLNFWLLVLSSFIKKHFEPAGLTLNTPGDLAISLGTSDTVSYCIHKIGCGLCYLETSGSDDSSIAYMGDTYHNH